MAHDREDTAKSKELTPAVALLLEAERKADELVARANTDAEEIVADAKRRAQQIRERGGPVGRAVMVSQELEARKRTIVGQGEQRIEAMRREAQAKLAQAVEQLVAALIGE
jgi:V/A-type H+/Na+-transporting ATPase subunit G/H